MPEEGRSAAPMPLLTLAIPTYNRAADLERLLTSLEPQIKSHPEIDLYISDNASQDDTPQLIRRFQASGMVLRYHRYGENIGADANFLSCFRAARGQYFWLCGDDEAILPGGVDLILQHLGSQPELDILYLSSYDFLQDYLAEQKPDKFQRQHHTFTSTDELMFAINISFTFISGVVVNHRRLQQLPHEDPSLFLGTNLVQLSWALPLLRAHRRSRILWTRMVAARAGNSGGYSLGNVFGKNLSEVTRRLLPDHPRLADSLLNAALRRWFPSTILAMRESGEQTMQLEDTHRILEPLFGSNARYWLFVYPALTLPLPLASFWVKICRRLGSVADKIRHPLFWQKAT